MSIPITSSPIQHGATGIIAATMVDAAEVKLFHLLYAEVVRRYQDRDPNQVVASGMQPPRTMRAGGHLDRLGSFLH